MSLAEIDNQIEHLMRQRDVITRTQVRSICSGCPSASNPHRITIHSVCCDVRNVLYGMKCHNVTSCKRVMK